MPAVVDIGPHRVRTISAAEISLWCRTSILFGQLPQGEAEAELIRERVRGVLFILPAEQLAVLLTALTGSLTPEWAGLRTQIELLLG